MVPVAYLYDDGNLLGHTKRGMKKAGGLKNSDSISSDSLTKTLKIKKYLTI
jgi:hypothetical protein